MPYLALAPLSKYGYLGVQLFFMISGFVILMTAAQGSFRAFAISRFARLYPAFWVCCTCSALVILLAGAPRYTVTLLQYLGNLTMFPAQLGLPAIDGVYWSLNVEMKFYALVGIVLLLGQISRAENLLLCWFLLSGVLELTPIGRLRGALLVEYSPFFIAGAVCYLIWLRGPSIVRLSVLGGSWCFAILNCVAALSELEQHYRTSFSALAVGGIITIFYVVMLAIAFRIVPTRAGVHWSAIGALTYPLYLLHENIGFIVFNFAFPALNPHLVFWGVIAGLLMLSHGVHVLVERRYSKLLKSSLHQLLDEGSRLIAKAALYSKVE
jgi:peptidoglycan/LPS O-acetylase OafA/YrhL